MKPAPSLLALLLVLPLLAAAPASQPATRPAVNYEISGSVFLTDSNLHANPLAGIIVALKKDALAPTAPLKDRLKNDVQKEKKRLDFLKATNAQLSAAKKEAEQLAKEHPEQDMRALQMGAAKAGIGIAAVDGIVDGIKSYLDRAKKLSARLPEKQMLSRSCKDFRSVDKSGNSPCFGDPKRDFATTDLNGAFSISAPAGNYFLYVWKKTNDTTAEWIVPIEVTASKKIVLSNANASLLRHGPSPEESFATALKQAAGLPDQPINP